MRPDVHVVGGGLAGCEAAWQLATRGLKIALVDMKPALSPAHQSVLLGELVCSNSLRSNDKMAPAGLLKAELRRLGSLIMRCADEYRVPAGDALAVDRLEFARAITAELAVHPLVRIERRVANDLPEGLVILATGPLTQGALADHVRRALGGERLYFYDAIAPIVDADSIDLTRTFRSSRWDEERKARGGLASAGDYLNCPLSRDEYYTFVRALQDGKKVAPKGFEEPKYFEGCLPIEVLAERGDDALAFGPMRPVGLVDPINRIKPFAVVQLRAENRHLTAYNLVGFQTRLTYPEQKRIFRLIPALEKAEFLRLGSIHRNSYIDSPNLLSPRFALESQPSLRFAGQITGVEGYIESCATGLLAALFAWSELSGQRPLLPPPPRTTAIGALHQHVTAKRPKGCAFTPTNINFGLLPPALESVKKRDRRASQVARAEAALEQWILEHRLAGSQ